MAHSPRLLAFTVPTFFVVNSMSPAFAVAEEPSDSLRVTAVANATVRVAPSPDAPALAQIPLGTEIQESGPSGFDKTWILVRLDDAREGWLQARLTKPLDPIWRSETYDAIIAERLARKGDGFGAAAELVAFIERVAPHYGDPSSRAVVDLARLRALSRAARAVPSGAPAREPYASWLEAHRRDVVYDEPAGRWTLRNEIVWDLHARHRDAPAADDIAWFAVENGIAGECEGHAACYFAATNMLQGEYLRAHPFGRHATEAVVAVARTVQTVAPAGAISTAYRFNAKDDCPQLIFAMDGLTAALRAANDATGASTLTGLAAIRQWCR